MNIKTSELTGNLLDWAVATALGYIHEEPGVDYGYIRWRRPEDDCVQCYAFCPSTDWSQGGPIIERELHALDHIGSEQSRGVTAIIKRKDMKNGGWVHGYGPTPLIAAMRCFVASKLGEEVDVPEELCGDIK